MGKHHFTREDWEHAAERSILVRRADPETDRLFLNCFVYRRVSGRAVDEALAKLGGRMDDWFLDDPDYWIEYGKVREEEDVELLKRIAWSGHDRPARFAFCRLTGYRYPAPECDADSHRTNYCGRASGMTPERVREFCAEMAARGGPFAAEARACLADPPRTVEEINAANRAAGLDVTVVGPTV